jgi:hypothetical protein
MSRTVLRFNGRRLIMKHPLLTGVALSLVALSSSTAAADWVRIEFPAKGQVGVVGGKVGVVSPSLTPYLWSAFIGEGETDIRVREPEKWAGLYLAYDPEGKDKAVFLTSKPGKGTKWRLARLKGPGAGLYEYSIRAAEGKVKGWYLDIDPKGEERRDAKGNSFTAYRVFLAETPKHLPKGAEFTEIAP